MNRNHGLGQEKLSKLLLAGGQLIGLEQGKRCRDFGGSKVDPVPAPVSQRPNALTRSRKLDGQDPGRLKITRSSQLLSSLNLAVMYSGQVDRPSRSPADALDRLVMTMQTPDPHDPASRLPFQVLADGDVSRSHCSRDHRTMPGYGEGSIDGHAEEPRILPERDARAEPCQLVLEHVNTQAGHRRGPHDGRPIEKGASNQLADLILDQADPRVKLAQSTFNNFVQLQISVFHRACIYGVLIG